MNTLFHYCTTDTFMRIIEGQSIRLSALSLSNDSMEGKLLHRALMALAERDKLDPKKQSLLSENLALVHDEFDALGCCLSEEGDILSQWRAYANDGKGFSIGFNKAYFELMEKKVKSIKLRQVSYVDLANIETLAPLEKHYQSIVTQLNEIPEINSKLSGLLDVRTPLERRADGKAYKKALTKLLTKIYKLYNEIFTFKSVAFKEEKEWRVFYMYPPGIYQFMDSVEFSVDGYRPTADKLIPFKVLKRVKEDAPQWINEVVIGPKNQTPIHVVRNVLKQYGFEGVNVRTSAATYR